MNWLAPAAFAGVLLVALPMLIHMMGRGRTTVIRFPSLRFLETSRVLPARRARIHDIALLLLRAGAIVAAAVALAQPRFRAHAMAPGLEGDVARIVVLDTSASMQRAVQGAGANIGKRIADSLANAPTRVAIVRAADLRIALSGAEAWAATQAGRVEIVVVSDFQRGSLDSAAVAALAPSLGLQLHRVRLNASPVLVSHTRQGGSDVSARIAFAGDRTDVEWAIAPAVSRASMIQLRSGAGTTDLVTATRRGADAVGVPSGARGSRADARAIVGGNAGTAENTTTTAIAIVFPGDASFAAVRSNGLPLTSRTQAGIAVRLFNDPLLSSASGQTTTVPTTANSEDTALQSLVERIGMTVENGRPVPAVISRVPVGTVASAALVAAVERAAATAPPVSELEPEFITDATLEAWQRPAGDRLAGDRLAGDRPAAKSVNPTDPAEFDGRWFWLLALLLLGGEALLRRAPQYTEARNVG